MLSPMPRRRQTDRPNQNPQRDEPSGKAMRAAQAALLARARPVICGLGVLATSVLILGAAAPGTVPPLALAAFILLLLFAMPLSGRERTRLSVTWAASVGVVWLAVVLTLVKPTSVTGVLAIATGSTVLLAAALLAAPDLGIALLLAAPASIAIVSIDVRLPVRHWSGLSLLVLAVSMPALIAFGHRLVRVRLLAGLDEQGRSQSARRHLQQIETAAAGFVWTSDAAGRLTRLTGSDPRVHPGGAGGAESLPAQAEVARDLGGVRLCSLPDRQRDTAGAIARLETLVDRHEPFRDAVLPITLSGDSRWVSLSGQPVTGETGAFAGYEGIALDVTAGYENERKTSELAYNDPLTGLPNRESFSSRTQDACRAGWQVALICVSLDDFGAINTTLGALAGDQLLIAFARRLRNAVRASDFVARLGGGEFGVLTLGLEPERVAELAGRIAIEAGAPYRLEDFDAEVASAVHLGISLAPDDAQDAQSLARNASLALARARRDNLDRPRFFEAPMLEELQAERALAGDLRQAIARSELSVCYHPVVDLETGVPVSAEALLRWRHPTRGDIPPSSFVPMAEASGTIVPIGRFALNEACREAASWIGEARVAVNVSPAQFRDETLLSSIDAALAHARLPAARLDIEITESVLLHANRSTLALLRALRDRGIRVALDDFGTGYSSLRYLRSFRFDKVKIDASFVRDMTTDREAAAIVRTIVDLARDLGMRALAEGIETEAQRDALRRLGCHEGQGYLFSRVLDAQAAAVFMGRT